MKLEGGLPGAESQELPEEADYKPENFPQFFAVGDNQFEGFFHAFAGRFQKNFRRGGRSTPFSQRQKQIKSSSNSSNNSWQQNSLTNAPTQPGNREVPEVPSTLSRKIPSP